MGVYLYQPQGTFLHRLNPVAKVVAFSCFILVATLYLDVAVPGVFLIVAWLIAGTLGRISPLHLLQRLTRLLPPVIGIALCTAVFYGGPRQQLVLALGPLGIWREGLETGGSIALRILCIASYSALYVITTDPSRLAASLIQQARMPYRLAYALLIAYRFLPILQREMANIQAAHRVRAADVPDRWTSWLERVKRFSIPLLVSGIRQAERLAIAMDARGFGALPTRTRYIQAKMTVWDYVFLIAALLACPVILLVLGQAGLLRGFLSGVAESVVGAP